MASRRPATTIRAAGGVVWRHRNGGLELAVVHRPRYDDWSLPKGKLEAGESELAAAVREVGEELGSQVAVARRLRRIKYRFGDQDKTVAFWAMRHVAGEFVENAEVDAAEWLAPSAARARLSYGVEQHVVDDFTTLPPPDSVVALVRHAKAGKRGEWHGDDAKRPLDRTGRVQAGRLRTFLGYFAPDRVVSAGPVRCVQTVTPLADALGLEVVVDTAFSDEEFVAAPAAAQDALIALAKPGRASVVCSQGTTIPSLIDSLTGGIQPSDTRKGAAWVLTFADTTIVSADYYEDAAR